MICVHHFSSCFIHISVNKLQQQNLICPPARYVPSTGRLANWTTCLGVTVFIGVVKFFLTTPINPVTFPRETQVTQTSLRAIGVTITHAFREISQEESQLEKTQSLWFAVSWRWLVSGGRCWPREARPTLTTGHQPAHTDAKPDAVFSDGP